MARDETLAQLEKRLDELEGGRQSKDEARRLWAQVREETDLDKLLKQLQVATSDRRAPNRARIHGVIDDVLANDGNVLPVSWTIIVTSSEPCVIIAVTVVTLTVCDTEPEPGPIISG